MVEQTRVCVRGKMCDHCDKTAMAWAANSGISGKQRDQVFVFTCLMNLPHPCVGLLV